MSDYLRVLIDYLFGTDMYINKIAWLSTTRTANCQYKLRKNPEKYDTLLVYAKAAGYTFNATYTPDDTKFNKTDGRGQYYITNCELNASAARHNLQYEFMGYTPKYGWNVCKDKLQKYFSDGRLVFINGKPRLKIYKDMYKGKLLNNLWLDIPTIKSEYPTQKPEKLLERIILSGTEP